jgi:hypothetical protein
VYLSGKLHKALFIAFPRERFIGKSVTYKEISKKMNTLLRPLGAKGRVVRDEDITAITNKREIFDFSGYYDTELKSFPICITFHVAHNKETVKFTKEKYNMFLFGLSRVIQHEFIHKSQFTFHPEHAERKIKVYYSNKVSKERKEQIDYLRERCEVEAYAHDLALEINNFYPKENAQKVVKNIDNYRRLQTYIKYKNVFYGTEWSQVKKSLLRKTLKWIPVAHIVPKK